MQSEKEAKEMNINIQESLDKIMSALPADTVEKATSCKSKEEFLNVISPSAVTGLLGASPIGGFLQSTGVMSQATDFLKDVEWSDIKGYLTKFKK